MANKKAEILTMDGQVVSPITLATNVLLEDGRTAQDLLDSRDESMFSPTITTSSSISKVGQGDNVDFSENIIDGAYKSCVLKGKTLVNHNAEGNNRNEYACMPSLEGSNLTVNGTVEGKVKSAILKGKTLVNLIKKPTPENYGDNKEWKVQGSSSPTHTCNSDGSITVTSTIKGSMVLDYNNLTLFKPNTEYTLFVSVDWNGVGVAPHFSKISTNDISLNNGLNIVKFTTVSDLTVQYMAFRLGYTGGLPIGCEYTFNNIMVIEGDHTQEDISYFTGIQSVRMPVLTTTGKNLFDFKNAQWLKGGNFNPTYGNSGNIVIENMSLKLSNPSSCVGTIVNGLKPNTEYYVTAKVTNTSPMVINSGLSYGVNNTTINGGINRKLTTNSKGELAISIGVYRENTNGGYVLVENIQVEEGSVATSYEPYKTNILTVNEPIELRGIGDVKDELNVLTREMAQCIGEIVLDGSEDWTVTWKGQNHTMFTFRSNLFINETSVTNLICDTFPMINAYQQEFEGVYIQKNASSPMLRITISNSKLPSIDANGFKSYLSSNNVKVIYKTPEKVIKTVDLSDNVVHSYKDTTHYTCSSEGGSLIPTLAIEEGVKYKAIIKPSTKYSVVFNRTEVASGLTVDLGGATANIVSSTLGKNIVQITTPSTLSHSYVVFKGLGNVIKDVQVIEGDVVGDEPYFEGMCDVEMPVVKNVGKNLFNKETVSYNTIIDGKGNASTNTNYVSSDFIRIKENTTYYTNGLTVVIGYDTNKQSLGYLRNYSFDGSFTTPANCNFVRIRNFSSLTDLEAQKTLIESVQFEQSSTSTPYEPYKINILSTPSDLKLRGIGDVKDTLDLETGVYVQRIGEIVFDGSEDWIVNGYTNNQSNVLSYFSFRPSNLNCILNQRNGGLGSKLHNIDCASFPNNEGWQIYNGQVRVNVLKSKLSEDSVIGFKQWLSQNPVTVQYELATPITKTIDLKQHPFAYKDGYVVLTSSSEEVSLTPTIEYSLIANRLGQIQSNQKLVEKQQAQIDELESMVVANLVNTQYQQALNEIKLGVK